MTRCQFCDIIISSQQLTDIHSTAIALQIVPPAVTFYFIYQSLFLAIGALHYHRKLWEDFIAAMFYYQHALLIASSPCGLGEDTRGPFNSVILMPSL